MRLILSQLLQAYSKKSTFKALLWSIAYAGICTFILNYFFGVVGESPVWIPAGIGLGVLLTLGRRYWPFIFVAAVVGEMGGGHDWLMATQLAFGSVCGFLVAATILNRFTTFNSQLQSVGDYVRLLSAALIAALISTSLNIQFLIWGGLMPLDNLTPIYQKWFTGDFFGMAFVAPALLILNGTWPKSWTREKYIVLSLMLFVIFILGQAIFFGWFKEYLDLTGRGYSFLFMMAIMGLFFGRQGAMLLFTLALAQTILGAFYGDGFFAANLMSRASPTMLWFYLALLCTVGLLVGMVVERFNLKNEELQSAVEVAESSEERFRQIVSNTPVLMATYNLHSEVTDYVNPCFTQTLGYVASDFLLPNSWWLAAYPDPVYREEVEGEWNKRAVQSQATQSPFAPFETKTSCKDGSVRIINWGCFFVADRMVIYGVDVTEEKRAAELLNVTSAVYRAMGDAVVIKDAKNSILMVNEAFETLTGFNTADLQGKSFSDFLVKKHGARSYSDIFTTLEAMGRWEGQAWLRLKNGEEVLRFISIYSTFDPQGIPLQRVALISEVTDQRKARELINQQANFDPLTALPNRRLMFDRLEQLIKQSVRSEKSIAIVYIDLDNFKDINDSRGHDFGDQLLKAVSARLRSEVRDTDTVARIGGDEFVILLGDLDRPEMADAIIREVSKKLVDPILIEGQLVYVTASMGIAMFPNDGSNGKALLLAADQAMYAAKSQGRNTYQYFTQSLQINASYRAGIIAELRAAIEMRQFELFYQPIVHLKTGKIAHAEALLRWRRSSGEVVLPSAFIQIAEESGLIVEIGNWVWSEAVSFLSSLKNKANFTLAVNVAASQFNSSQHSAVNWLEVLKQHHVEPQSIVLEITERMMLNQSHRVMRKIAILQEAGCKFSVDDFGTGYSSLASLKSFNFDYIKIDADFIKPLSPGSQDAALVFAMISMAKGLGLASVAEGVETKEQAQILATMNCTYAQGYLYSKPMPAEEFRQLLLGQH
ncbi:MAG: bifunctional diguanylate cyclase/phosphodiesterase [Polynucleobacter sp.]